MEKPAPLRMATATAKRPHSRASGRSDLWTYSAEAGGLLEGVSHSEHAEISQVRPDDLESDGQSAWREAARYRERR